MPLHIDTTKCEDPDTNYTRTVADIMYAVGVGQIRNEDEAMKLYRRYYMLRLSRNDISGSWALVPYSVIYRFIGAHTNVSDVSDFQFNKSLILELNKTANSYLNRELGGI
jgi:hypothetical protein